MRGNDSIPQPIMPYLKKEIAADSTLQTFQHEQCDFTITMETADEINGCVNEAQPAVTACRHRRSNGPQMHLESRLACFVARR